MAPNKPNEYNNIVEDPLEILSSTVNIRTLKLPLPSAADSSSTSVIRQQPLSQPAEENKLYYGYNAIHTMATNLLPAVRSFNPSVFLAVNSGGSFLSLLLSAQLPNTISLPVTLSCQHDYVANKDNHTVRTEQWFDESSSCGMRINGGRILVLLDQNDPDIIEFILGEVHRRYMPENIKVAVLHTRQSNLCQHDDLIYASAVSAQTILCYPWNATMDIESHTAKAEKCKGEQDVKAASEPEESVNYWDWPDDVQEEDPLSLPSVEKCLVSEARYEETKEMEHPNNITLSQENYWDWDAIMSTQVELENQELVNRIIGEERIRLMFTADAIEKTLKRPSTTLEEKVSRNEKSSLLGDACNYWDWSQDERNETSLQEERNRDLLSKIIEEEKMRTDFMVVKLENLLISDVKRRQYLEEEKSAEALDDNYWQWSEDRFSNQRKKSADCLTLKHLEQRLTEDSIDENTNKISSDTQNVSAAVQGYWEWPCESTCDSSTPDVYQLLDYIIMHDKIQSSLSAKHIQELLSGNVNSYDDKKEVVVASTDTENSGYWIM